MFVLSPASLLDELPHPVQIPGVELCCAFSLLIPSIASNNASSALGSCSPHFDLCFVGWSAVSPSCCGVAMVSVPQQAVVWGVSSDAVATTMFFSSHLSRVAQESAQGANGVSSTHKRTSVLFSFVVIGFEKEVTIYK